MDQELKSNQRERSYPLPYPIHRSYPNLTQQELPGRTISYRRRATLTMSIIASLATGYAAKSYLTPITPFHQPYVLHMADKPSPEDVLTCSRDPLCLSITQDDSSAAEADQQEGEQR